MREGVVVPAAVVWREAVVVPAAVVWREAVVVPGEVVVRERAGVRRAVGKAGWGVPRAGLAARVRGFSLRRGRTRPRLRGPGRGPAVAGVGLRRGRTWPGFRGPRRPPAVAGVSLGREIGSPGILRHVPGPGVRGLGLGPGSQRPGIFRVGQRPEILRRCALAAVRPEPRISGAAWQRRGSTAAAACRRLRGHLAALGRPHLGVIVARLTGGEGIFRVSHPCPPRPYLVPPARDHEKNQGMVHFPVIMCPIPLQLRDSVGAGSSLSGAASCAGRQPSGTGSCGGWRPVRGAGNHRRPRNV